ncbi:MAG: FHA domain-containing protein [Myxococcota bacterium]
MHSAVGEIAFPLKAGGSLVIGRLGSMVDVEISWDPRISRRHCRIWEKDGRIWFQDLSSRNGSWVDDARVSGVVRLRPGSEVILGETILRIPRIDEAEGSGVEDTHERELTKDEAAFLGALREAAETSSQSLPEPPPRNHTLPARAAAPLPEPPLPEPPIPEPPPPEVAPPDTEDAEVIASPTVDLRSPSEVQNLPLSGPTGHSPVRGNPRFVSTTRVKVRARDRADLKDLWMRDISKGGLFVETKVPPPSGTRLEVQLETPAGTIQLEGTVVHVLTPEMTASFGGQPGVGIQFMDLDPGTREAIQAYVEGLAQELSGGSQDLERLSEEESEEVLQRARRFLHDAEKSDFYAALEIRPTAGVERIEEATSALHKRMSEAVERMPPPRAARVEAALNVLARVRRVLTHEDGRLEYDFRNGHIRAQDRLMNAQQGGSPGLATLRQAWNRVFPERVDRAALLTRKAFAARQRQDLAAAIDAGRAALELNPFFEELKQTVEVWESSASER